MRGSMTKEKTPEISIGMPVYNGEKILPKALDALLSQTYKNFELIISDNDSTDDTKKICMDYAAKDNRIRYIRQPENKGAAFNFFYVLKEAKCKYFMWAAHDDFWEPAFIEENYKILEENEDVVLSVSKVRFIGKEDLSYRNIGTFPISGPYNKRVRKYLWVPGYNSRYYGLCRREPLLKSVFTEIFWASDWAIMLNLIKYGNFAEVDKLLMYRGSQGASKSRVDLLNYLGIKGIKTFFPFFDFTKYIIKSYGLLFLLRHSDSILKWNVHFTWRSIKAFLKFDK